MDYNNLISRVFALPNLKEIARFGTSKYLIDLLLDTKPHRAWTLNQYFEHWYSILKTSYRSEYYYKNEIVRQLLLKKHSKRRAGLLTELRSGDGKADIVILNGSTWVYEIKTELDNTSRLKTQLESYRKLFKHVSVVTHHSMVDKVKSEIDNEAGIIIMNENNELVVYRKSKGTSEKIDKQVSLRTLRKNEYLSLVTDSLGGAKHIPATALFGEAEKIVNSISSERMHKIVLESLRSRSRRIIDWEFCAQLPESLKFHGITAGFTLAEKQGLLVNLSNSTSTD